MKWIILAVFASVASSLAQGLVIIDNKVISTPANSPLSVTKNQPENQSTNYFLKTLDGNSYEVVSFNKIEPDYLYITIKQHAVAGGAGGIFGTRVSYDVLPADLFKRFHYDLTEAANYREWRERREEEVREREYEQWQEDVKRIHEEQKIQAQVAIADAMKVESEQLKRAATAQEQQAKAAMIQATNPPTQIQNTVVQQVQQVQQNNWFNGY